MNIGIVANAPKSLLPNFERFKDEIDCWIGVDKGTLHVLEQDISIDCAIGDFDSISEKEMTMIKSHAQSMKIFPREKDQTDLELAIDEAILRKPNHIYMFGVSGGRIDHSLINIQLLYHMLQKGISGTIIDAFNELTMRNPGTYRIQQDPNYKYISFVPQTEFIEGLTLEGFAYPLYKHTIQWGQTICISNELIQDEGTYSYDRGILLEIKSRD